MAAMAAAADDLAAELAADSPPAPSQQPTFDVSGLEAPEVAPLGLMSNTASSVFFMAEAEGRRFARELRGP